MSMDENFEKRRNLNITIHEKYSADTQPYLQQESMQNCSIKLILATEVRPIVTLKKTDIIDMLEVSQRNLLEGKKMENMRKMVNESIIPFNNKRSQNRKECILK